MLQFFQSAHCFLASFVRFFITHVINFYVILTFFFVHVFWVSCHFFPSIDFKKCKFNSSTWGHPQVSSVTYKSSSKVNVLSLVILGWGFLIWGSEKLHLYFYLFILVALRFELRASGLQSRPSVHFTLIILEMGVL
jgi:hypothetical protein